MIIQAVLGSSCVPSAPRSLLIGSTTIARADHAAGHQIGVSADVLGQRIEHEVGAVRERTLKHRAQKGVVHQHRRARARPARAPIFSEISRISARSTRLLVGLAGVSVMMRQTAAALLRGPRPRSLGGLRDGGAIVARVKLTALTPKAGKRLVDQASPSRRTTADSSRSHRPAARTPREPSKWPTCRSRTPRPSRPAPTARAGPRAPRGWDC